ncbi:MAG: GWxTD domain-containing protein [Bacteroidales bacterium]
MRLKFVGSLVTIILLALLISCSSSKKTSKPRSFDSLYDPNFISLFPDIRIYSKNDDSSTIYIRIRQQELLFNQANEENKLQASININYLLYEIIDNQQFIDSGYVFQNLEKQPSEYFIFEIPVPTKKQRNYLIEIEVSDQNRNTSRILFETISRTEQLNQQDFVITDSATNEIFFEPYINPNKPFKIKHYNQKFDSLFVSFYKQDFITPLPPNDQRIIIDSLRIPDTIFICYPDSINYEAFIQEGNYVLNPSKNPENGFLLQNYGISFPNVVTPCQLIEPLIYITSIGNCNDDSTNGRTTKLMVDNFWLSKAKNANRSRELIKIFYTRVMYANKFFTSYKPGWQTDRGIIYIVYGPPDYLYKSAKEERWIYSPRDMGPGVVFNFEKTNHNLTTNHFVLNRAKQKITGWDENVKMWNSGEVYYFQP